MFLTIEIRDHVYIRAHKLGVESKMIVSKEITRKYANKVISNVGLVICLVDVLEMGDLMIHPTDGGATVKVRFSLLVFKPVVGEILVGQILRSSEDGIDVSMTFFDDVHIPLCYLQPPSSYRVPEYTSSGKPNNGKKVWIWDYEDSHQMDMEDGDSIMFRVSFVHYAASRPDLLGTEGEEVKNIPPKNDEASEWEQPETVTLIRTLAADTREYIAKRKQEQEQELDEEEEDDEEEGSSEGNVGVQAVEGDAKLSVDIEYGKPHSDSLAILLRKPMCIIGSINEDGLGLVDWWL